MSAARHPGPSAQLTKEEVRLRLGKLLLRVAPEVAQWLRLWAPALDVLTQFPHLKFRCLQQAAQLPGLKITLFPAFISPLRM